MSRSQDSGSSGDRTFGYDSRGNVTAAGGQGFVYDRSNRVTQLTGAVTGSYNYDGHLRRVRSDVAGARRYHVYSLGGELVHVDSVTDAKRTDYVFLGKQAVARVTNGVATYLHNDLLGSAVAGSNAQGQVVWRERYTPFGDTLTNPVANANLAGYTGHVRDADTGLVYMQARYYDPVIGRFYSNDPVDTLGHFSTPNGINGFNRYAYSNNNPYTYTDPTGEASKKTGEPGEAGARLAEVIMDIINNPDNWIPKRVDGNSNIQDNKANGKSFEQHVKSKIDSNTPSNVTVSEQVTLRTNDGTNTVMDLVVSDGKSTVCVECKASDTAPLTGNQNKAHPLIAVSGAQVRGQGKPAVPGGTQIVPSKVIVARPKMKL